MIRFTRLETREIDEKKVFDSVKDFLLDEEIEFSNIDDYKILSHLPKDAQRLIFAKVGAMMIDYAGSEEF